MPMKKMLTAGMSAVMLLVLILDGQAALQSASDGILLCLHTVIPSLFPFLFLCSLITSSMWGEPIPWLRHIADRLGIPAGGESLLVSAFLGGYPAGAQAIGACFREGYLSRHDAQRLLPVCNNAGPAFLFGMVALQFARADTVAALWLIQILATLFVSIISADSTEHTVSLTGNATPISEILIRSVRIMATICGWIILFQILIGFMVRWVLWLFPQDLQIMLIGLLELSSGCCQLHQIISTDLRFLICTVQLSFGGICVMMQTASVIGDLSMARYFRGKLVQTAASAIMAAFYLQWGWPFLVCAGAVVLFFPIRMKNGCRFSPLRGV